MRKGETVTKLPDTRISHEVATFGIVRVDASKETSLERMSIHELTVQHALSIETGFLSDPPQTGDFNGLTINEGDLEVLLESKVGDSAIKLSESAINRLHDPVSGIRPDAPSFLSETYGAILMDYAARYRARGGAGMVVYHDKKDPLTLEQEYEGLIREAAFLQDYYPDFDVYLRTGSQDSTLDTEQTILWAQDDFSTKRTVISVTEAVVYRADGYDFTDIVIAAKRLYASHYVESSLGITALADDPEENPDRFYLIHMNRVRIDGLRSRWLRFFAKSRITDGWIKRLDSELRHVKQRAEAEI